ncbi:MAG: bifunctional UDP-sugar hydrolase/5'-nucleotidase [Gemmatimonadaceae bacterium]
MKTLVKLAVSTLFMAAGMACGRSSFAQGAATNLTGDPFTMARVARTTSTPNRTSSAPQTFTVLHTNDIHGDIREFAVDTGDATSQTGDPGRSFQQYPKAGMIGGFARLATAVADVRSARGANNVLLVDAGDTFGDQLLSNITRGESTARLLDAVGYTFMALGNHDYEYTSDNTIRLQTLVTFPMRAANAIVHATGQPFLGNPTLVVTAGGVRVGLLALTYHNTDQTGNKDNTKELEFQNGLEVARKYLPELRQRADVIIVVSHQGTAVDSLLAARVRGIDIIIGGHSHDRIAPPRKIGDTWMVQALSDASALGELTVTVDSGHISRVVGAVHELYADQYKPNTRIVAMIDSIRAPYRDTLNAVIATATSRIGRQYKSESPIDMMAAELLREYGQAEVAFLPGLGFGVTIQPGAITREMLFNMFPHPTSVVHERLTGAQILAVLEQSATNLRPADDLDRVGGLVQTAGIRWTIDLTKPIQHRIRGVFVGSQPIETGRSYTVMTNGGLLQGTHRQTVFAQGTDIVKDVQPFAAFLEGALRSRGTVRAPQPGAITLLR